MFCWWSARAFGIVLVALDGDAEIPAGVPSRRQIEEVVASRCASATIASGGKPIRMTARKPDGQHAAARGEMNRQHDLACPGRATSDDRRGRTRCGSGCWRTIACRTTSAITRHERRAPPVRSPRGGRRRPRCESRRRPRPRSRRGPSTMATQVERRRPLRQFHARYCSARFGRKLLTAAGLRPLAQLGQARDLRRGCARASSSRSRSSPARR